MIISILYEEMSRNILSNPFSHMSLLSRSSPAILSFRRRTRGTRWRRGRGRGRGGGLEGRVVECLHLLAALNHKIKRGPMNNCMSCMFLIMYTIMRILKTNICYLFFNFNLLKWLQSVNYVTIFLPHFDFLKGCIEKFNLFRTRVSLTTRTHTKTTTTK